MNAVPQARRVSAVVAIVAVLVVLVVTLVRQPLALVAAVVSLGVAIASAAYAVTRTGWRRRAAVAVAVVALAAPLVMVVAYGQLLQLVVALVLVVVAGVASRYALGRDLESLKSSPTPGTAVGPAARPVLLMNPKSGGGKVERFNLVEEARRRGITAIVLAQATTCSSWPSRPWLTAPTCSVWPAATAPKPWSPAWPPATASGSSACPPAPATTWPWTPGWTAATAHRRGQPRHRRGSVRVQTGRGEVRAAAGRRRPMASSRGLAGMERHHLRGALGPAGGGGPGRRGSGPRPADPVPDSAGRPAGPDSPRRPRLLACRRRANQGLGDHDRAAADRRRPAGHARAMNHVRSAPTIRPTMIPLRRDRCLGPAGPAGPG
jgi:hypothetical protein